MAYWKDSNKKRNYTPLEDQEQQCFIEWCEYMASTYEGLNLIYAIPNGGSRNQLEAVKLKRTGVKAGVPDLCLPVARKGKHGLYIEMKRKEGGRVSELQKEWLEKLSGQGYETAVCHGMDEAIKVVESYYG